MQIRSANTVYKKCLIDKFNQSFVSNSRYDPANDSYHHDIEGNGIICSVVDNLPTEFPKEVLYFTYSSLKCIIVLFI